MTLLHEIQNIVCTVDASYADAGKWTWSFEFEKRIEFRIKRSVPRKDAQRSPSARSVPASDDDSDDDSDGSEPVPDASNRIQQARAAPALGRRIQPPRAVKRASLQKIIAKKPSAKPPVAKKKAPAQQNAPAKKKPPAKKKAPAQEKPPAEKKTPAKKKPPAKKKVAITRKTPAKRRQHVPYHDVDLLVKVKRNNVCIFYLIGIGHILVAPCTLAMLAYHTRQNIGVNANILFILGDCVHSFEISTQRLFNPAYILTMFCWMGQSRMKCQSASR